jgi:multicomponent Na+:H+ antiporter subunit C
METSLVHPVAVAVLLLLGAGGVLTAPGMVRKIVALNVMAAAVTLLLVSGAPEGRPADPTARAMAVVGIVVALGVSAFALYLARRIRLRVTRGAERE